MVDRTAAKVALLVGGGVLAFMVAGAVLRFVARIASFAVVALLGVVLAYVAYEAVKGWRGAGEAERDERSVDADDGAFEAGLDETGGSDPEFEAEVLDDREREELDRELDELLDDR